MALPDLTGRRAVVTGANAGLGFVSAKALAEAGAEVVLAVRNLEKGTEAQERLAQSGLGDRVSVARLDLADLGSVQGFAAEQLAAGPLDLLLNNAGLMMVPERQLTPAGFEVQMGVNHLGHFALTALLLPALTAAPAGRVVSLTSLAHRMAGPLDPRLGTAGTYRAFSAYAQSKLACALFGFELDRRLRKAGSPVISVVAHPGLAATELFTRHQHQRLSDRLLAFTPLVGSSPAHGAQSQLRAATDPTLKGGELIGPRFLIRGGPVREVPAAAARNWSAAMLLWDLSVSLTETPFDLPPAVSAISTLRTEDQDDSGDSSAA